VADLGCDWHTVMDAVNHHGRALIDDPNRVGKTVAVGFDEVLFCGEGKFKHRLWSTQVVDVARSQLLDVVPGRDAASCCRWFADQPVEWMAQIRWATLDLSGSYRSVFDTMLPHGVQIADPFHVVKLANFVLDEVRRRVQNETCRYRGRETDPIYRCRKLLLTGSERVNERGRDRILLSLRTGDPNDEVVGAWLAKESVRDVYLAGNYAVAVLDKAVASGRDDDVAEIRSLGNTLKSWRTEILNRHTTGASNGPTEGLNLCVKKVKRCGHSFRRFDNYRLRVLLHTGGMTRPERPSPPRIRTRQSPLR
jgi:transposase